MKFLLSKVVWKNFLLAIFVKNAYFGPQNFPYDCNLWRKMWTNVLKSCQRVERTPKILTITRTCMKFLLSKVVWKNFLLAIFVKNAYFGPQNFPYDCNLWRKMWTNVLKSCQRVERTPKILTITRTCMKFLLSKVVWKNFLLAIFVKNAYFGPQNFPYDCNLWRKMWTNVLKSCRRVERTPKILTITRTCMKFFAIKSGLEKLFTCNFCQKCLLWTSKFSIWLQFMTKNVNKCVKIVPKSGENAKNTHYNTHMYEIFCYQKWSGKTFYLQFLSKMPTLDLKIFHMTAIYDEKCEQMC